MSRLVVHGSQDSWLSLRREFETVCTALFERTQLLRLRAGTVAQLHKGGAIHCHCLRHL